MLEKNPLLECKIPFNHCSELQRAGSGQSGRDLRVFGGKLEGVRAQPYIEQAAGVGSISVVEIDEEQKELLRGYCCSGSAFRELLPWVHDHLSADLSADVAHQNLRYLR